MLRIGMGGKTPPPEELPTKMPQEQAVSEPAMLEDSTLPSEDDLGAISPSAKVSMDIARYLGPDQKCQACQYWEEPNACSLVDGEIDPMGTCFLFTPVDQEAEPTEAEGMPEATDVEPVDEESMAE